MEVSELRIGNMINTKVGRLLGQNDMVIVDTNHLIHIQNGNEYNYEPIPLTPEWLNRLGFENPKQYLYVIMAKHNQLALIPRKTKYMVSVSGAFGLVNFSQIEHVHSLQNLYHALTGEELTPKQDA